MYERWPLIKSSQILDIGSGAPFGQLQNLNPKSLLGFYRCARGDIRHRPITRVARNTLLSGNRVYGSVGQTGDGVIGCTGLSGDQLCWVKMIKNNEKKEHGCTGTGTADLWHGQQACSPLPYGGCCWKPGLFEGIVSPCFLHMYIATANTTRH